MKLILRIFFLFFVLSSTHLFSQTKFQRVYGGIDSIQDGLDIKQTSDGGYIINGRISTFKSNPAGEDGYLIKTNSAGIMTWSKRYGTPNYWEGASIVQTTDGGYFFAGENKSWSYGGSMDFDLYAMKVTASGAVQWQRDLGDTWNEGAYAAQQTTDGGYMCFGMTSDIASNGYMDYYLVKLNNAGTLQWSKTYGGTYMDFGYDARQTQDGGYIMTGFSYSFGSGTSVYVTKADVNGNAQWGTVINGPYDEYSYGVYQTSDGGYIVTGGTQSYGMGNTDVFLVRLNSAGGVTWTKTYGAGNGECGLCVRQTTDGGFAVCGNTNSIGNGGFDLFLLKTDSGGNLLWTKTYGGSADEGPAGGMFFSYSNLYAHSVKMDLTNDGGFAITSQANSFAGGNVYFVKTDANGNSGCNETNGTFLSTSPTPTVTSYVGQTVPTTQSTSPAPTVTTPATVDSNACQCTLPVPAVSSNTTICQSQNATLTASGGTTYSWSNGITTSAISVSPSVTTTYSVIVSNSCGSAKDSVKVIVNPLPTATASSNYTICPGATVTLSGSGTGTSYSWSPGGQTTSSIPVSPTSNTTYTFFATNSCGTANSNVTVTVNSAITATVSGNTSLCAGQSATLTASGGSSFSWSNGSTLNPISVTPTSSATYSVIATSGSCSDTTSITVNVTAMPVANIASNTTICAGQTATLTASGGGNYLWNTTATTSAITVSPTAATNYSVVVTNASGCSASASASVTLSGAPAANISSSTTICRGDAATLTASGGGNYLWNTSATTTSISVSPSSSASYTVTVTNASGCSATANATVTVSPPPTALINGNTTICSGQSATLTASGGTNYSWSTGVTAGSIIISPTSAATYSVIAITGTCSDTTSAIVSVNPLPTPSVTGNTTICNGASSTLTASGGGNYSWNTTATTSSISVSPTASTNYSVVVTNASGCSASASASVTVSGAPSANISGSTTICRGDMATLTASGGGNYLWNTSATTTSISVSPSSSTSYTVTVTNASGCSATANATVTVSPPPTAVINGNTTICSGQSATLTASGGTNYSWSTGVTTGSIIISPTSAATYSVIAITGTCSDTTSAIVSVNPLPTPSVTGNTTICNGASSTLTASGGGTYSWNPGGQTTSSIIISPTATSAYSVTVTSASGCSKSANAQVTVSAGPNASINGNTLLCRGDAATLTASGGNSYSWNTGATSATISGAPTSTTTYTVVASNASGCTSASTATVTVSPPPVALISGNNTVCLGDNTILTASGGGNYSWNTGQTSSSISVVPSATTTYSVFVSVGSCKDTAAYSVAVVPNPTATAASNVTISQGQSTTLTATGGGTYSWSSGGATATISVTPLVTTTYCVFVTDANGCSDSACVKVTVTPMECPEEVYVPNAFSPNGDGENDLFRVYFVNIACVKKFSMEIYDRWGEKVFQSAEPVFFWGGEHNGTVMNSAVFVYYMYVQFVSGQEVNKKGNVSLVR